MPVVSTHSRFLEGKDYWISFYKTCTWHKIWSRAGDLRVNSISFIGRCEQLGGRILSKIHDHPENLFKHSVEDIREESNLGRPGAQKGRSWKGGKS